MAQEALRWMVEDRSNFRRMMVENNEDGGKAPFLARVPVREFVDRLLGLNPGDMREVLTSIYCRYDPQSPGQLIDERQWMARVKEEILCRLEGMSNLRRFQMNLLFDTCLDPIIEGVRRG